MNDLFDWPLAFDAEKFSAATLTSSFLELNSFAKHLAERMRDETGTDFFEWIDHLILPLEHKKALLDLGFVAEDVGCFRGETVLGHPKATLPRVILAANAGLEVALRPEFLADFVAAHSLKGPGLRGEPQPAVAGGYGQRRRGGAGLRRWSGMGIAGL